MSIFSKMKNGLINLYLAPLQKNYALGLSSRNRIFMYQAHLIGLLFSLRKINHDKLKGLILDIGCHRGGTSGFFAKHFKGLRIIGFEPNKEAFENAKQNFHSYSNLQFENIAVS